MVSNGRFKESRASAFVERPSIVQVAGIEESGALIACINYAPQRQPRVMQIAYTRGINSNIQ